MATGYSINVHAKDETPIRCFSLRGPNTDTNVLSIADVSIFAGPADLRRLVDEVNSHLVRIEAEQVAA